MASLRTIARVQRLIWVLIYGGLLLLVLGLATRAADPATSWTLILLGTLAAVAGAILVWVRSRLNAD